MSSINGNSSPTLPDNNVLANNVLADNGFSDEQKNFLQGFVSGTDLARSSRNLPTFASALGLANAAQNAPVDTQSSTRLVPNGPEAIHFEGWNRTEAEGGKLCPEEAMKRDSNPLDAWDEINAHAGEEKFPKGLDVFRFKTHGLFYVAPAQDSFMCRLRFHGGIMTSFQMRKVAEMSRLYGGGYSDVTTRANLQIREIGVADDAKLLMGLQDAGITARGAGADNIRNITGAPTAGIDPQEIYDTRQLCADMHYHILHHRELYGLPRKFNIAFDGGGAISAVADTNDIGFLAVRVLDGKAIPAGVYFRVQLGGITGHGDFARDTGLMLKPEECVQVASAMVKVFIQHGDRTDRKKSRLKYLLDNWGFEKFLDETQKLLPFQMGRFPLEDCEPRPQTQKHGHIGVHPQRQEGLRYVGVLLPVGRIQNDQMLGLADIADKYGSGTIRLTVWQNLLISDVREENMDRVLEEIQQLGLATSSSSIRGALIACTGNRGCKFANTDTKGHALQIADALEARLQIDTPLNIHLTGCPNSCAQHYIGDIGMLGTKVEEDDDMVEGYHLYVGGGYGDEQGIAREVLRDMKAKDADRVLETLLGNYQATRQHESETFLEWSRRYSTEELQAIAQNAL